MTEVTEMADAANVTGMNATQVLDAPDVPGEPCSLTTDFDEPATCVPPLTVTSGHEPALQVADRFFRGRAIVGRGAASPAALGLKVDTEGRAVQVRFTVRWDSQTFPCWDRRADKAMPRESAWAPRLILVHVQRRLRHAVLLSPPRGRGQSLGTVVIDLAPEEVPADGLLLLELWGAAECPGALPPGGAGVFAPNATAGIAITDLHIHEPRPRPSLELGDNGRSSEADGIVSLGGLSRRQLETTGPRRLPYELIVVNPNPRAVRLRLTKAAPHTAGRSPLRRFGALGVTWFGAFARTRLGARAITRVARLGMLSGTRFARIGASGFASAGQAGPGGSVRPVRPVRPADLGLLRELAGTDAHSASGRPGALRLGTGQIGDIRAKRRSGGWDIVVPAAEEPILVVVPGADRKYKLVSCVPEPADGR